jgi:hypothetical protein
MAAGKMCMYHPKRKAVTSCFQCHKPLCADCVVEAGDGRFCSTLCAEKHQDYKAAFGDKSKTVKTVKHRESLSRFIVRIALIVVAVIIVLKIGAALKIGLFVKLCDLIPFL